MNWTTSIIWNALLIAAVIYGVLTHRRWLWITAAAILVLMVAAVVVAMAGSTSAEYILN
jgi:hypothetical protein